MSCAGRHAGPSIEIAKPEKFVGTSHAARGRGRRTPAATVSALQIVFEQNGKQTPLYTPGRGRSGDGAASWTGRQARRHPRDRQADGARSQVAAPARIVVTAARPVLRGHADARVDAPRTTSRSGSSRRASRSSRRNHYINLGGSEMVVYRVTPADVDVGRARRRPRVSGLSRDRRRRSRASRSPTRRCASPSSRCSTTRT